MALADVGPTDGTENADTPSMAQLPSQRITPYISKVAPRPASVTKAHTPSTGGKFAERQGAGSVVASLNAHLEVPSTSEEEAMDVDGEQGAAQRCDVAVLGQPLTYGSKYMVDRLEDKVGRCGGCEWDSGCCVGG